MSAAERKRCVGALYCGAGSPQPLGAAMLSSRSRAISIASSRLRMGKMLSPANLWRDGFKTVVKEMGIDIRFHSFRRFRESVLQASECRELVIDYWMGHENADMSSRYGKQLLSNRVFLAEWAEKVGLGFEIPSEPGLVAIRAIRNQDSVVAA